MCVICGIDQLDSIEHLEEEIKKLNEEDLKDLVKFIKSMIKYCEDDHNAPPENEEVIKKTLAELKRTQYILGRFL